MIKLEAMTDRSSLPGCQMNSTTQELTLTIRDKVALNAMKKHMIGTRETMKVQTPGNQMNDSGNSMTFDNNLTPHSQTEVIESSDY